MPEPEDKLENQSEKPPKLPSYEHWYDTGNKWPVWGDKGWPIPKEDSDDKDLQRQ